VKTMPPAERCMANYLCSTACPFLNIFATKKKGEGKGEEKKKEIESAVYRRLVEHLRGRHLFHNIVQL